MLKLLLLTLSLLLLPMISKIYTWVTLLTMILSVLIYSATLMNNAPYSMLSEFSSSDTMSSSLSILTIWVTAMMILASTKIYASNNAPKLFTTNVVILTTILILCFNASNIFMFYIWFEASLIPTMILIMMWGYQPERLQASMYLMIYTVTASLPMLTALYKIYMTSKSTQLPMFMSLNFPMDYPSLSLAWLMTLAGFMVKLPMFTVHLWLPKAHVEAPIAGSMILAAILLKLGGYGLLRMSSLFSHMLKYLSAPTMSIALTGAVVTSMICMRQPDLKSLIAYSSVGHMGLMIAGMSSNTNWGMQASLAMMVAHGLSSSALFVMANMNYEITSTRSLYLTKGLMVIMPALTMWWFLFTASNMAAPPSINLLSEIMLITSIMSSTIWTIILLSFTSFLTAAYSLLMFTSMGHGSFTTSTNPLMNVKSKDFTLMTMHLVPVVLVILKPELITNWV
uniref:NADH-ubiquinone oxidoreductase chain 4 n=1 Tax=Perionyx excavatus TaxID=168854 RepID=A6YFD8_9ANNE|nr:NADH dehydrogenase subunit 4 [Perionyx excavatus]ABQ01589.1 NADH dehydrogenase subunit 4 [Perionyx excavatus]